MRPRFVTRKIFVTFWLPSRHIGGWRRQGDKERRKGWRANAGVGITNARTAGRNSGRMKVARSRRGGPNGRAKSTTCARDAKPSWKQRKTGATEKGAKDEENRCFEPGNAQRSRGGR